MSDFADPDVRYLVVTSPRASVENYAYGTTRVITEDPGQGWGPVTVAIVLGTPGREGHAEYLAEYQEARFRSGNIHATICTTWAHAARVARDYATGEYVARHSSSV